MSYLVRLTLLVLGLVLSLALVWLSLFLYAQGPAPAPYQTQALKSLQVRDRPLIWRSAPSSPPSLPAISTFYEDGMWKTLWKDKVRPLEEALAEGLGSESLFLMMEAPRRDALPALRELFKSGDLGQKVIFCSRGDGLLQDLRQLEPEWTFCTGEIFMTRLLAMDSLRLGGLSRIPGDVFFVHLTHMGLNSAVHGLLAEAKRQGRFTMIGPLTESDFQLLHKEYSPDGWWTVPNGDENATRIQ